MNIEYTRTTRHEYKKLYTAFAKNDGTVNCQLGAFKCMYSMCQLAEPTLEIAAYNSFVLQSFYQNEVYLKATDIFPNESLSILVLPFAVKCNFRLKFNGAFCNRRCVEQLSSAEFELRFTWK